jgi:hypothetical protein
MALAWRILGLVVMMALASKARGEENYPFCIDFQQGSSLVYQLPRSALARQPKWNAGDGLPVPLSKLCRIALDKTNDPQSSDTSGWRVEHVQFWRVKGPQYPGNNPRFQATADIPSDLQDRWFVVFQLSDYKNHTGDWWKNSKYAVVMLDGTYVPLSPAHL